MTWLHEALRVLFYDCALTQLSKPMDWYMISLALRHASLTTFTT
jgi:hypothetical protein